MLSQLVFTLDSQRYGFPLARVLRVMCTLEVTPLPKAPEIVLGVIDLEGNIVPVMSMRKRFGLAKPEINLSDQLLVADTPTRRVARLVNAVTESLSEPVKRLQRQRKSCRAQSIENPKHVYFFDCRVLPKLYRLIHVLFGAMPWRTSILPQAAVRLL
jgi:chemotaxis signal transduction protein